MYSCDVKATFSAAITLVFLHYLLKFGHAVNIQEPQKQWILKETSQPAEHMYRHSTRCLQCNVSL